MPKEIANTYIEYENMLDSYAFVLYNIGIPIKYFPPKFVLPAGVGENNENTKPRIEEQ